MELMEVRVAPSRDPSFGQAQYKAAKLQGGIFFSTRFLLNFSHLVFCDKQNYQLDNKMLNSSIESTSACNMCNSPWSYGAIKQLSGMLQSARNSIQQLVHASLLPNHTLFKVVLAATDWNWAQFPSKSHGIFQGPRSLWPSRVSDMTILNRKQGQHLNTMHHLALL